MTYTLAATARTAKTADLIEDCGYGEETLSYAEERLEAMLPALHEARKAITADLDLCEVVRRNEEFLLLDMKAHDLYLACKGTPVAEEYRLWFGRYGIYWEMEAGWDA